MKYRKKPVVIEAWKWDKEGDPVFPEFLLNSKTPIRFSKVAGGPKLRGRIFIDTFEGQMAADFGDWIIKGVEGEVYPCKPSVFEKTYEKVE